MLILGRCRSIRLTPKWGWRRMGVRRIRGLAVDVLEHASLAFPQSLPEFLRLFPDDAACAAYLEKSRWEGNFVCPHCQTGGEPFRFDNRPGVLRCRKCRRNTGLMVGTVMELSLIHI